MTNGCFLFTFVLCFQEGDKLIGAMVKKFKFNKDMWYNAALFYMRSSQMEKARALLNRALTFLSKKDREYLLC
jgi:hypothetical protein